MILRGGVHLHLGELADCIGNLLQQLGRPDVSWNKLVGQGTTFTFSLFHPEVEHQLHCIGFWSSHFTKVSPDKDVFGRQDKIKIYGRLMDRRFCLRMPRRFIICAARCLCLQVLNLNQNLTNISPKTSAQTIIPPIYKWVLLMPISDYFTFWWVGWLLIAKRITRFFRLYLF